jgi:hypothetical protein
MSDTMRLSGKTWSGSMSGGNTKGKGKEDAALCLSLKKNDHSAIVQTKR